MQQDIVEMPVQIVHTEMVNLNDAYQKRWCFHKWSIAIVQTKVVTCNDVYKSWNWQLLHKKAIAALTQ